MALSSDCVNEDTLLWPWTLLETEATVDVPHLVDLDQTVTEYMKVNGEKTRDMRAAWKEYYLSRMPPSSEKQIKNFLRIACVQGHGNEEENEDAKAKLEPVSVQLDPQKIADILQNATVTAHSYFHGQT